MRPLSTIRVDELRARLAKALPAEARATLLEECAAVYLKPELGMVSRNLRDAREAEAVALGVEQLRQYLWNQANPDVIAEAAYKGRVIAKAQRLVNNFKGRQRNLQRRLGAEQKVDRALTTGPGQRQFKGGSRTGISEARFVDYAQLKHEIEAEIGPLPYLQAHKQCEAIRLRVLGAALGMYLSPETLKDLARQPKDFWKYHSYRTGEAVVEEFVRRRQAARAS
jgi:hypothetical protein